MSIQIEILQETDFQSYEEFILSDEKNLLFSSLKYRNLLLDYLKCDSQYIVAKRDGTIKGVMPLMFLEGKHGKIINSLPFYGSNGGILTDDNEVYSALYNFYLTRISSSEVASSCFINNPFTGSRNDFKHDHLDYRIGQITPLIQGDTEGEELIMTFHYKTRNMVRKAQKQGFTHQIEHDEALGFLYDTHLENMDAIGGKAKDKSFFDLIPKHFKSSSDFDIHMAYLNGIPTAAMLVFKYNKTIEYFTPVIKQEFRNLQPMSLLIFNAMSKYQNEGFKYWNWGGTWESQEGVYRFKNRWNAADHKYDYYINVNNQSLLEQSGSDLVNEYPGFYTVPFSILKNS